MGNAIERQQQLLNIINSRGMLPIKALSNILGVSEMTIRRDIKNLKNAAPSTQAGKDFSGFQHPEYNLLDELEKSNEQKISIGRFASSLIAKDDVIIIDTGSTTARMLPYIPTDIPITLLCFNANVLDGARDHSNINILFGGGFYHRKTEMFESQESLQFISKIRANKVFLSAAGIHKTLGITCANNYEVATKQAIIRSSQEKILLADSSKFDAVRSAYFGDLTDITAIVTDKNISNDWREYLSSLDIKLYIV